MLTVDQKTHRRLAIGSSDVSALLGFSPWKTAYDLWLDKTGRIPDSAEADTAWTDAGNWLEPAVLSKFEMEYGPLERSKLVERPELNLAVNVDAVLISTNEPVEAKTAGLFGPLSKEWGEAGSEGVPVQYIVQAHAHMIALDAQVCHIPALLTGVGFTVFKVKRSEALVGIILRKIESFWRDNVLADTPPANSTPTPDVIKLTRREPGKIAIIPALLKEELERAAEAKRVAEQEYKVAQAAIRMMDPDAEAFDCGDPQKIITDYEQGRATLDADGIKSSHPEIYNKFAGETRFRVMRISKRPKGSWL